MKKKIILLSGPVRSGKTSSLLKLLSPPSTYAGGFLTPDIGDNRIILDLHSGQKHAFQIEDRKNENIVEVGRFRFLKSAFDYASHLCLTHTEEGFSLIVVDEIGKLEMRDEGFHDLIEELLFRQKSDQTLLFVVRDFLLEDVVSKYRIENALIISKVELEEKPQILFS